MSVFDGVFFLSSFTTLIVISDPLGNLPVFIGLTARFTAKERNRVAFNAVLTSVLVLLFFGLFGSALLRLLDLSTESMQISGGILLLIVSLQLMLGIGENSSDEEGESSTRANVATVPLGIPLLAGPGTVVAIMVAANQARESAGAVVALIAAFVLVHLIEWVVFRFANPIHRVIGDPGTVLLTRLAGMILAAISVQMVIDGIVSVVQHA